MNNLSKTIENEDGTKATVVINSNDNYNLKLDKNYKIANRTNQKESKLAKKFKGSIWGSDIGIKSNGFSNVAILATVLAFAAIAIMYFLWRF